MRKITTEELNKIIKEHEMWLKNKGGKLADLRGTDLNNKDLYGVNLKGANLSGADLSGANLEAAYLYGTDLSETNLSGANLRIANLYRADLRGANLYGANLEAAYLYGVNLREANLRGANLYGTDTTNACFKDALVADKELKGDKNKKVDHPDRYCHGIKAIDYIESHNMNFNLGNVIKYVTRAGLKSENAIEDLQKAKWYIEREIGRGNCNECWLEWAREQLLNELGIGAESGNE